MKTSKMCHSAAD